MMDSFSGRSVVLKEGRGNIVPVDFKLVAAKPLIKFSITILNIYR